MPIFGLGLHILIAIFFAIHALRTGRELFWLIVLFSFPLLGSVVYFAVVFLPQSKMERGLRGAGKALAKTINPGSALREAQTAFDLTPTAHNQMRLARAMLDAGMTAQAVAQYDICLAGPFANDPEIGMGAAMAKLANGQPQDALKVLAAVRAFAPTKPAPNLPRCRRALTVLKCAQNTRSGRWGRVMRRPRNANWLKLTMRANTWRATSVACIRICFGEWTRRARNDVRAAARPGAWRVQSRLEVLKSLPKSTVSAGPAGSGLLK